MKKIMYPYLDTGQPIEKRVDDLLSRMTDDEKIAQLQARWGFEILGPKGIDKKKSQEVLGGGIGQISRIAGMMLLSPFISAWLINSIQRFLKNHTRLGIPVIVHEECLAGLQARGAVSFPQIIGLASTWEPELARKMTDIIRAEMRAIGVCQGLSPVLDIARDPRWGRTEETYGEDPYLVSCMGTEYVKGLQGTDPVQGVAATAKHFIGYSMSEGGLNWAPPHLDGRELYEVFARPFEAAIRVGGLRSVMNAYNEINGVPCAVSHDILQKLLREKLGFEGFVVADYMAVATSFTYHHAAAGMSEAGAQALTAGLDIELPTVEAYGSPLKQALTDGRISAETLNTAVRRVLKAKFELGLFEQPYVKMRNIKRVFSLPAGRELSLEIARRSIILLKNENGLLPLPKDVSSLAVIGPSADSMRNLLGDYSYVSQLEGVLDFLLNPNTVMTQETSEEDKKQALRFYKEILDAEDDEAFSKKVYQGKTVYRAILDKVQNKLSVRYAGGCGILDPSEQGFAEALKLAETSDVVILVGGDRSGLKNNCTSGEARDRTDLNLPGVQEQLLRALAATGKPLVLVLINGRPLSLKWAHEHVPAIIESWVPGEQGGAAIADVLFGDVNPGGKLPITVPRSVGQVPVYYNHKPSGGRSNWHGDYVDEPVKPLYEFGYGLSYTTFSYDNLSVTPAAVDIRGEVTVRFSVTNNGNRAGDEVAQLYVHDAEADVTRPVKELAGFKRVHLAPGEACEIIITMNMLQLAFLNRKGDLVVEPGEIEVMVGSSSEDIRLRGGFTITGKEMKLAGRTEFFSRADVRPL
jgi:beta-glucosidase